MMAEGGPPQYNRRPGTVLFNEETGRGSYLIRVQSDDNETLDYQPGHVLALEVKNPEADEEWMRGPYTVTRSDASSFDVLYRVVGNKTRVFRELKRGDGVRFGGKFKVPVAEGIVRDEALERVVGLGTGVGIGPLVGFAEQALSGGDLSCRVDLYGAFRDEEDVCCMDAVRSLQRYYPERFSFTPVISSTQGRFSATVNLKNILQSSSSSALSTHFHLVGNGSMVNEWKQALADARIPENRVTLEMYFNHKVQPDPQAIKSIVEAFEDVAIPA